MNDSPLSPLPEKEDALSPRGQLLALIEQLEEPTIKELLAFTAGYEAALQTHSLLENSPLTKR